VKGNLTVQNTRKLFGGRGLAPDAAEGGYSAPANPLVGGRGWLSLHKNPNPPLSVLPASPLVGLPTPKLVPTPLQATKAQIV